MLHGYHPGKTNELVVTERGSDNVGLGSERCDSESLALIDYLSICVEKHFHLMVYEWFKSLGMDGHELQTDQFVFDDSFLDYFIVIKSFCFVGGFGA